MANGGDNDLEIKLKIDAADALAKQAQVGQSFNKVAAQADAAAKKAAQSQFSAFDLQARAARKLAAEQAAAAQRAAAAQTAAAKKAAEAQLKAMNSVTLKAIVTEAAIRAIGNAFTSITHIGISFFTGLASHAAESQKKITEYAENLSKVKEDLKELATLRGLSSASDEFVAKMANFSRQTGMTIAQATEFHTQFYGSIAGGMQLGNIDEATAEKLAVEAGKIASRQTKDYATRGDLAGMLAQFAPYHGMPGVASAMGEMEAVRVGLGEGRGEDTALTKSLLHIMGSLSGPGKMIPRAGETASVLGVASLSAGAMMADTRTEQLMRALRGDTPQQIQFLKEFAGIKEGQAFEERLDRMIFSLRQKRSEGRDIRTFLTESGMGSELARSVEETEPLYEVTKERMVKARAAGAASGKALMKESEQQEKYNALQRLKVARAGLAEAQLERGKEREAILPDIERGKELMVRAGIDTSITPAWQLYLWGRSAASLFQVSGEEIVARELATKELEAKTGFKAAGSALDIPGDLIGNAIRSGMAALFGQQHEDLKYLRSIYDVQLKIKDAMDEQNKINQQRQLGPGRMGGAPPGPATK
jgi:hypothetical protein